MNAKTISIYLLFGCKHNCRRIAWQVMRSGGGVGGARKRENILNKDCIFSGRKRDLVNAMQYF